MDIKQSAISLAFLIALSYATLSEVFAEKPSDVAKKETSSTWSYTNIYGEGSPS